MNDCMVYAYALHTGRGLVLWHMVSYGSWKRVGTYKTISTLQRAVQRRADGHRIPVVMLLVSRDTAPLDVVSVSIQPPSLDDSEDVQP
jgi:hypothetical protein